MRYWLAEATDKSGALWGFLVEGTHPSKPEVARQLKALGRATEISGQSVNVGALDLGSVEIRGDATRRFVASERFSLEGKAVGVTRRPPKVNRLAG